jgi:3-methylcrotonyl-CoA carboxylase alpha subunit
MRKILIANRGEIARRVIRTAHAMGLETVAVYSDADALSLHVREATQAVHIGPAPAAESYLRIDATLDAARRTGADAIHPGYGFLSENAAFAEACEQAGLIFIGPPPSAIRAMGLKDQAKKIMKVAGVPVVPGYQGDDQTLDRLVRAAQAIGYPILIKAVAGGGGKGMRRVDDPATFAENLMSCQREAARAFGNDMVLLERYVGNPRHVEIQVFADSFGNVIHLHERDCSVQRRHQKVIEEAPGPGITPDMRAAMGAAAVQAAKAIGYVGAGTVEFIADFNGETPHFYFMEMNTRLQVEHPVTEMITGLDLVEWQIRIARGEPLPLAQDDVPLRGHAIEVRLYAEDPDTGFLPSIGRLDRLHFPGARTGLRIDSGVEQGSEVTIHYDPMIAKLIAHGPDRASAIEKLLAALDETVVEGVRTNRAYLARLLGHPEFRNGAVSTAFIDRHAESLKPPSVVPDRIIALAALALVTPQDNGSAAASTSFASVWTAHGAWRLNLPVTRTVELGLPGGTPLTLRLVEAERTQRIEGLATALAGTGRWREPTRFEADFDGQLIRATVLIQPTSIEVRCWGQTFQLNRPDAVSDAAETAGTDGTVKAPMPGKVLQVLVKPEQSVAAGDRLLVLEAMKMEQRLTAPLAGTIKAIHVREGDQVSDGAVLVEIAPVQP